MASTPPPRKTVGNPSKAKPFRNPSEKSTIKPNFRQFVIRQVTHPPSPEEDLYEVDKLV